MLHLKIIEKVASNTQVTHIIKFSCPSEELLTKNNIVLVIIQADNGKRLNKNAKPRQYKDKLLRRKMVQSKHIRRKR